MDTLSLDTHRRPSPASATHRWRRVTDSSISREKTIGTAAAAPCWRWAMFAAGGRAIECRGHCHTLLRADAGDAQAQADMGALFCWQARTRRRWLTAGGRRAGQRRCHAVAGDGQRGRDSGMTTWPSCGLARAAALGHRIAAYQLSSCARVPVGPGDRPDASPKVCSFFYSMLRKFSRGLYGHFSLSCWRERVGVRVAKASAAASHPSPTLSPRRRGE